MPQRGKVFVNAWVRAECRPESRPSRNGELALTASRIGRTGRSRSQTRHRAVDVADADVDVQRERVVAPRDVLQPLDDPAVVLGVDVGLLAVVGPRVRPGRAERDAVGGDEARTAGCARRAGLAIASWKSSPRPERISISDSISSPAMACASTGSLASAALRSSSKRGTRSSVSGSRIANSSSIPTVKSVEAAKAPGTLSRSMAIREAAPTSGRSTARRAGRRRGWRCGP